jgi:hypothetical protein
MTNTLDELAPPRERPPRPRKNDPPHIAAVYFINSRLPEPRFTRTDVAEIVRVLRSENHPQQWGIIGNRHALFFINPHHPKALERIPHIQRNGELFVLPPFNSDPRSFWWWNGSVLTIVDGAEMLQKVEEVIKCS